MKNLNKILALLIVVSAALLAACESEVKENKLVNSIWYAVEESSNNFTYKYKVKFTEDQIIFYLQDGACPDKVNARFVFAINYKYKNNKLELAPNNNLPEVMFTRYFDSGACLSEDYCKQKFGNQTITWNQVISTKFKPNVLIDLDPDAEEFHFAFISAMQNNDNELVFKKQK